MSKGPNFLFEQSYINDQVLQILLGHSKFHNTKNTFCSTETPEILQAKL
jgi:hypothetical protein